MRRDHRASPHRGRRARGCCPSCSTAIGLPLRSSIDVVVFAIACLGAERARRLHRARLLRPRRLVRAWRLCGGALAASTGSPAARPADPVRASSSSPSPSALARRADPAPARRLFLAADAGADRDAVRDRLSAGRSSPAARAVSAASRARPCSASISSATRSTTGSSPPIGFVVAFLLWRFHRSPARQRARRDPRERAARPLSRLPDEPLQAPRLRDLGDGRRPRRRALGVQPPLRLGRAARRSPSRAS